MIIQIWNLFQLGIAAAVGVGAAAVGVALTIQAANARNVLNNNVDDATARTNSLINILDAQSPTLTSITMTQVPTSTRLTSVCSALAAVGALGNAPAIPTFTDVESVILALMNNACI